MRSRGEEELVAHKEPPSGTPKASGEQKSDLSSGSEFR
jgi:hypothetical protein